MFDAFLKIEGIPGESTDSKHTDWIEILSFNHGVMQPASTTASSSGGAGAERATFSTVDITKLVDKSSPKLYEASFTGKHISKITLEFCRAGGDKEKYLDIVLEQVIITTFTQGGAGSGDGEFPVERVSFVPGKIKMNYVQQKRDGKPSGNIAAGWDLTANKTYA
jgi:type VI secretion system secreted protein Hcp